MEGQLGFNWHQSRENRPSQHGRPPFAAPSAATWSRQPPRRGARPARPPRKKSPPGHRHSTWFSFILLHGRIQTRFLFTSSFSSGVLISSDLVRLLTRRFKKKRLRRENRNKHRAPCRRKEGKQGNRSPGMKSKKGGVAGGTKLSQSSDLESGPWFWRVQGQGPRAAERKGGVRARYHSELRTWDWPGPLWLYLNEVPLVSISKTRPT